MSGETGERDHSPVAAYLATNLSRLLEKRSVRQGNAMQPLQGWPLVGYFVEDCLIWLPSGGACQSHSSLY